MRPRTPKTESAEMWRAWVKVVRNGDGGMHPARRRGGLGFLGPCQQQTCSAAEVRVDDIIVMVSSPFFWS